MKQILSNLCAFYNPTNMIIADKYKFRPLKVDFMECENILRHNKIAFLLELPQNNIPCEYFTISLRHSLLPYFFG